MPHTYNAAFLKNLQCQTQQYSDRLERCVRDLEEDSGLSSSDGAVSVTEAGQECLNMLKQQQEAWQQILGTDKGNTDNAMSEDLPSQAVNEEQSRISRVAAMGGTPALGAGMVLPKLSQHQLNSLSSTESPAARELHAAQGRPDEAMSTSPPPSVNTPTNSPPWLIELRKQHQARGYNVTKHLDQGNSRPSSPPKQ